MSWALISARLLLSQLIRSRPRCYSLDASTFKQNLVNLLFPSSSFAEASSIDRYSIHTTSRIGFHTVEDWLLQRRARELYLPAHLHHCSEFWMLLPALWQELHRTHVSSIMKSLHWLPIAYRIHFKLSVLMHGVHNGTSPSYLTDTTTRSRHCQDIVSFVQQWRLNMTSLAPGQNLETELSLLLDSASETLFPPT